MNQPLTLTLMLICFVSVSAETLPRFLRGDKVRCLDRDSADNLGTFAGNVATDLLEANLIYWEGRSYKGDVVVAFINDVYWIDFDGKSDQPWHRSLSGNEHAGTDRCITEDHYQYLVDNPTNTVSNIEANIEYFDLKGGYGNAQRLRRLGSDYDISNCNQAEFKGVYHDIAKRWATSLQECHEVIVTQHQSSSDFGNFEDCWDECKSCYWTDPPDGHPSKWECNHNPFRPQCITKCGNQGTCCRHGKNDDLDHNDGLCNQDVDVTLKGSGSLIPNPPDNAKFSHNMEMGTYNHHGCVPRPRDPKTCKCQLLSESSRASYYIASNGLVKECPVCGEGYTTTGGLGQCSANTKCVRCPDNQYPEVAGSTCSTCPAITLKESHKCGMGKIWHACSNTNKGSCKDCGPEQYTEDKDVSTRVECKKCRDRVIECAGYNATLTGCSPGPGKCECNAGYQPITPGKNITKDNQCETCDVGHFKESISNNKCDECSTANGGKMYSSLPRNSSTDCSCYSVPNTKMYEFSGARECRQCRDFPDGHKYPYKPKDSPLDECRACSPGTWFDTDMDPAECTTIETMNLTCPDMSVGATIVINPPLDHYPSPFFNFKPANGNEVPIGYYLDTKTYKIKSCVDQCNDYQYSHLCGRPSSDGEIYWKKIETNEVTVMKGDFCDSSIPPPYKIKREGMCKDCKSCSDLEFNSGCGSNNAGTCQTCQTTCSTDYYLYHELSTGCNDPTAISDYECRECKKVERTGNNADFKYYIVESCGGNDYDRWGTDFTNGIQSIHCTSPSSSDTCNFDSVPPTIPITQHAGTHLPYCPPRYKVIEECFQQNPNLWNKDCCVECSADDPQKKKSANYEICPGNSPRDTQLWVDRCENNYYTDKSGAEEVCKPCEMCA